MTEERIAELRQRNSRQRGLSFEETQECLDENEKYKTALQDIKWKQNDRRNTPQAI